MINISFIDTEVLTEEMLGVKEWIRDFGSLRSWIRNEAHDSAGVLDQYSRDSQLFGGRAYPEGD